MVISRDVIDSFLEAAVWHGDLNKADAILAAHPGIATSGIHAAAVLGDDAAVSRFVSLDARSATAKAGPFECDALVLLCLSKYLRLDPSRSAAFLRAARALLDAGADAKSGFWSKGGHPEFETALYGAAGVAHHEKLTRLLLERGADPNDEEAVYHSPETCELGALKALVETGRLTPQSLATMLVRKHDWHDKEGVRYVLEHGADPNFGTRWRGTPMQHGIARDNDASILELALERGGDPTIDFGGVSGVVMAARRGRGDLLEMFERRGFPVQLPGAEGLIAACARNDAAAVRSIAGAEPGFVSDIVARGGTLLAEFAGTGNVEGVRQLLDLGIGVGAIYQGDPYFGIPKDSTALHVAAWRARHATVKLLIDRGAEVNAPDGEGAHCIDARGQGVRGLVLDGATLAGIGCVLLEADASVAGVAYPTGYAAIDELLKAGT